LLCPTATAKRNAKKPTLLQGILVCRECGYACYRSSTRTTNKPIYYYRCIGSDNYRHIGGRVCHSRPIRADELGELVWEEVRRLLEDPTLVQAEIDRRLTALRTEHPAAGSIERLNVSRYYRDVTRVRRWWCRRGERSLRGRRRDGRRRLGEVGVHEELSSLWARDA
jgi:site-specific DNA recombinase